MVSVGQKKKKKKKKNSLLKVYPEYRGLKENGNVI